MTGLWRAASTALMQRTLRTTARPPDHPSPSQGPAVSVQRRHPRQRGNRLQMVGSVDARRTISIGGEYTIGAWRYFFTYLAEDVLEDLKDKFPKVSEGKLPESQDQKPSNG